MSKKQKAVKKFEAEQSQMFVVDRDGKFVSQLKAVWHDDKAWMKEIMSRPASAREVNIQ